jgi:hypothetical protein
MNPIGIVKNDIKPHVPIYDSPAGPRVPEWMARLMAGYF